MSTLLYSPVGQVRVFYQWLRLEQLDQWWHWALLAAVVLLVLGFVVLWYRRDAAERPAAVRWALLLLRIGAFAGLLLYFLQLDKRSEERVVRSSRVVVLADTSLSMTLPGTPNSVGSTSRLSRSEELIQAFTESGLLSDLTQDHEVAVYRFDSAARPKPISFLPRKAQGQPDGPTSAASDKEFQWASQLAQVAVAVVAVGGLALLIALFSQILGFRQWRPAGSMLLAGSGILLVGLATLPFAIFPATEFTLGSLLRGSPVALPDSPAPSKAEETAPDREPVSVDWPGELSPTGTATRLGDALKAVLERESGSPLAAIIVLTDGGNNAGLAPKQLVASAQSARVPLHFVGIGSDQSPPNIQLVEIDLPKRLYPGDKFSLSALIGGSGFEGKSVAVQVLSGPVDGESSAFSISAEKTLPVPSDGQLQQVEFQLEPRTVGQWEYRVILVPPPGDANLEDNARRATVEVIERRNRVLIIAGGPTREYQFVRNLLYRDRDVESHVLLQSANSRSSQEAQKILEVFPRDRGELAEYDAVLAFDADWSQVAESSVAALEKWVAEQAGGFLMVAGSVEMPKWVSRSASGARSSLLRSLSPVVLDRRGSSLLAAGRVEAPEAWPLKLTADGARTDFLWIDEDPASSLEVWESFAGVHSYYTAYQLKPGAKALALFSDPTASVDGQLPIYMASQFYGAGRVVFMGGGEIWRIRSLGDAFFDRYYTKLVRWISQGRLLLDSDRGVLLVDREQATLGEQVVVRAVLKNERYEPLIQSEVVARMVSPDGRNTPLNLRPLADGSQPGVYTGQFPILLAGDYSIQLQLGGIASQEMLSASVRGRVPASEMQRPERNDALMTSMATATGGKFWPGVASAIVPGKERRIALGDNIESMDAVSFTPAAPDRVFQLRWFGWLLTWIAICLSVEWLSRRIYRLA